MCSRLWMWHRWRRHSLHAHSQRTAFIRDGCDEHDMVCLLSGTARSGRGMGVNAGMANGIDVAMVGAAAAAEDLQIR